MGTLVIKMTNKNYSLDCDIRNLIKYVAGEGKNGESQKVAYIGARGLSKNPDKAAKQIIKMQEAYGKNSKRRAYHMVVSYPEYVKGISKIRRDAKEISKRLFKRFQVYYAIHESTDNIHIHFVINSVSYRDGKKWHMNKAEFENWKKEIREI